MALKLRWYQQEAVDAIFNHLRTNKIEQPCVVLPTGAGKTLVMAEMASKAVTKWNGRVLILSHVKELLLQTYEKIIAYNPELKSVGVYSSGLNMRNDQSQIIVAGIQSVFKRACQLGKFDIIMVDEAHCIPVEAEGRYTTFLADMKVINPKVRVVGLTATPYRLKGGMICAPENMLNTICYEVGVRELIDQGFLSNLICKASLEKFDDKDLTIRMGDFIESQLEEKLDKDEIVSGAVKELIQYTQHDRKSVIVFCISIKHAIHVCDEIKKQGQLACEVLSSETSDTMRDDIINEFKAGTIKYICNVNILSIGFDAPKVDCIAMMRPTASCGLYYQQVGRGFRIAEGKKDCLILDYAGNVMRLGPVDDLNPKAKKEKSGDASSRDMAKECENCQSLIHVAFKTCPHCGFIFPEQDQVTHAMLAGTEEVISKTLKEEKIVDDISYSIHEKNGREMLKVQYRFKEDNDRYQYSYIDEYVCFEHDGYARTKAEKWYQNFNKNYMGEDVPKFTQQVIDIDFVRPLSIIVKKKSTEKFWNIKEYQVHQGSYIKI
jgi:DNA repair protein RadD